MKKYLVITFLLFTIVSFSQNKLSGKVVNDKNEPLQNVHLHVYKYDTNTDATGYFEIDSLPNGTFTLFATLLGYERYQTKIDINAVTKEVVITLISKINYIDEVHIEKISHNTRNVVNSNKIRLTSIEKMSDKSFSEVLKEVSGVSVLKSGNMVKPVINGLHSSRVTIITNNVRLEDQQWGMDHAPNLDLSSVGKINIYKGSNALQFSGDAVGGIVVVEPFELKKDTILGKTIFSLNSNGRGGAINTSFYQGKEKGLSYDFNTGLKYFGDREAPDYMLSNTGMNDFSVSSNLFFTKEKYTLKGFLSFYKTKLGILRAAHTGSSIDLYNSIQNHIPSYIAPFTYSIRNPRQEIFHIIGKIALDLEHWKFQYAAQYNDRLEFDIRRGDNANKPALSLGLMTQSILADWQTELAKFKIKSGISFSYQNNVARPETDIRPLIPNFTKYETGLYGIINSELNDNLAAEAGLRIDFTKINATKFYLKSRWLALRYDVLFPQFYVREENNQILMKPDFDYLNFSSNVGINYHFLEHWNWMPGVSLVMRNPNPAELFSDGLHHATGMIELGSLSLQKEKGFKFYSPIKFSNDRFDLEINPYVNLFSNFIYAEPKEVTSSNRGEFLVWEYKQAKARIMGIDLTSNYQINAHFNYKSKASFLDGYNRSENKYLIDMPPFNLTNEVGYTTNSLWHAQFIIRNEFVAQQKNVPNNNFVINIVQNNEQVPVLVDVSTAPKAYNLTHFEAQFEPKFFNNIKTTINLSVANLFNTNYRDYLNRQRFFADEMGRNFRIQFKFNY